MEKVAFFVGFLGSITASGLFFPQVWASYKSKNTKGLSWAGIFIGMLNGLCWVIYGIIKGDPFIYVTNTLFFIGAFLLMLLKHKYK